MEPSTMSWAVGETKHGQTLELTWVAAEKTWWLRKRAADQRDDECLIAGIPDCVILAMAAAVRAKQQAPK